MRILRNPEHRSSRDLPLLDLPPEALFDLLAQDGQGNPWHFCSAARTAGKKQLEGALVPLREALARHSAHLRPDDFAVSTRTARESLVLAEGAVEGLVLLGSPEALGVLGTYLGGVPPFAGEVALRLGEGGYEAAREPLVAVVLDTRYGGTARARAAALLVNRFADRRGLERLAPGLVGETEADFEVALSAFHGVEPGQRDDSYFVPVLAGLDAHERLPDRLAGLLGLVLGAAHLDAAIVTRLRPFLRDRRRHSGRYFATRPLRLERLAVACLARWRWQRGESAETEQAAYSRNPLRYWALRRRMETWVENSAASSGP